ncbi:TPA: hypothetical protein DDW35_12585 [Candidatus Sumerlaeota bacterium]|nr:hypothetical protein [Candidatus Sumerlaeota bacterium]
MNSNIPTTNNSPFVSPARKYILLLLDLLPFCYVGVSYLCIVRDNTPDAFTYALLGAVLFLAVAASIHFGIIMSLPTKHAASLRENCLFEQARLRELLLLFTVVHWLTLLFCYVCIEHVFFPNWIVARVVSVLLGSTAIAVSFFALDFLLRPKLPAGISGEESKNNEDVLACWKWGLFYWNPDDPKWEVKKLVGYGTTVNFAKQPRVLFWLVLLLLLLLALFIFFLLTPLELRGM